MRQLLTAVIAFAALPVAANVYITPVVSATVNGPVYTTTTVLRNSGSDTVKCESVYAIPNHPKGGTLRATYAVEAGIVQLEEGTLAGAGAVGTRRIECSGALLIAARIQRSTDGGKTFDAGRIFRAVGEEQAIPPNNSRSFQTQSDLLMMEVNGASVRARVVVKDRKGRVLGEKSYEVPAFAEQIVNLLQLRTKHLSGVVEITVSGAGTVVVTPESEDASIAALFNPAAPMPRVTSISTLTSTAVQALALSSFKAAPFVEPMNGLVYMRDRWYDPHTGSFLSPDPEGYADSANLFSYCHGDPVNCSDLTGRLDGGDLREDFRRKENAERARRAAAWCKANPVECKKLEVRGNGILRMAGGVGQTFAGAGAFASTGPLPEPVTKTLGGIAIVRGIDNTITGAVETWTGEQRSTMTGRALYLTLVKKGVDSATASRITGWTEVGVDVTSTLGSTVGTAYNASRMSLLAQRQELVNQLHLIELGTDPVKGFLVDEASAGARLESQVGRLQRDPSGTAEWIRGNTTYDAIGSGVNPDKLNMESFLNQLNRHLLKADRVVVDLSRLTPQQAAQVSSHVAGLSSAQRMQIIFIK
jgi:RHS repeat-associated protein